MTVARNQQGFALVEVLVALALLALVGLMASGALGFGTRVWERTDRNATELQTWARARGAIADLMAAARPRQDPETGGLAVLHGDAARIAFDIPGGVYGPGASPQRIELTVRDGGVALSTAASAQTLPAPGRLRFEFRGGADRTWRDRWDEAEGAPPLLVRVVSSDQEWPPLVVRLTVRTDPLCAFDLARGECRR